MPTQQTMQGPWKEWRAATSEAMQAVGSELAALLQPGDILLLEGQMGAGKTTLAKGIAAGFGAAAPDDVHSPTFPIVHEYRSADRQRIVFHLDLYRLANEKEVLATGLDDLLDSVADGEALMLVEWGERFPSLWPAEALRVRIQVQDELRTVTLRRPEAQDEQTAQSSR